MAKRIEPRYECIAYLSVEADLDYSQVSRHKKV